MGTTSYVAALLGASEQRLHILAEFWARFLLRVSSIRLRTEGLERLTPGRNYVLVSNHASYMDTPVLLVGLHMQFRFLAKKELFAIPFIGTHLTRAGHFPVERENVRASLKSMSEAAKRLKEQNISVLVFPEGGRTVRHLRSFKEGAAYIAIKAGVPVVPIALVGTREVLRMHSKEVIPGNVIVRVGEPIETSTLSLSDRNALNDRLREEVSRMSGDRFEEEKAEPVVA